MANKSDSVREMIAKHPDMTAGEVAEALAKKGVTVSTQLVYNLRAKPKAKKRKTLADVVAEGVATINEVRMPAKSSAGDVLGTIRKVKALADDVGGLPKLRSLVEAMS